MLQAPLYRTQSRFVGRSFLGRCLLLACLLWLDGAAAARLQHLEVGIFPRGDTAITRQMFQPIVRYLQRVLNTRVTLDVPPDYQSFWQRLEKGKYDLVHFNQYHYLRAHQQLGYRAILKNEEGGSSEISSVIWVRKDSDIQTVADLAGKKIFFGGGESAMVSSIMGKDMLHQAGLEESDYLPQYALTPMNAILGVYFGQAVAAACGDSLLHILDLYSDIDPTALRPLLQSRPIAHLPWAVSPDLDTKVAKRLQSVLIGLQESLHGRRLLAAAGLTALVPANDSEYDIHREIVLRVLGERF